MSAAAVSAPFGVSVRHADGAVVAVSGELDMVSAPALAAVLDALVARGHERITVECDDLSFIDAYGIRPLVAAQHQIVASNGEIHVQGLSDLAYRVFETTGLVELLHAQRRNLQPEAPENGETDRLALQVAGLAAESERAEELVTLLSQIIALAPVIIGPCDGASVTVRRGDHLITAAASDETVRFLDRAQYTDSGGPCVDATNQGIQIHAPDLGDERRWRPFTAQAQEHAMQSVLSSPLTARGQSTGALNLYSRTPGAFLVADRTRASAFAALVAVVLQPHGETSADRFGARISDALASRDAISQAQGVLMERLGVHAEDAYEILLRDSVGTSRPLRRHALDLIEETEERAAEPERKEPVHD